MVKLYHVGSIDMFNVILYNNNVLCSQMLKHTQTHNIFVDFVKCNKNTSIRNVPKATQVCLTTF